MKIGRHKKTVKKVQSKKLKRKNLEHTPLQWQMVKIPKLNQNKTSDNIL